MTNRDEKGGVVLLFTGSFDPVHAGHMEVVRIGLTFTNGRRLILLPNSIRSGKSLRPLEERLQELRRFFVREPKVEIADEQLLDIYHHQHEILAVASELRRRYPEWDLIRLSGSDSAYESRNLIAQIESGLQQAVVPRPGHEDEAQKLPPPVLLLPRQQLRISSTDIRKTEASGEAGRTSPTNRGR